MASYVYPILHFALLRIFFDHDRLCRSRTSHYGKAFEELEIAQKVEAAELRADMAGQKAALMAAKLRELGLDQITCKISNN
jgi:hypothetical protein